MNLHRFSILLTWISCQQIWVVYGCSSKCTSIDPGTNGFECNGKTINVCNTFSPSWKVYRLNWDQLHLSDCKTGPQAGDQLLLFVSSGKLVNYGKYEIVTVKLVTSTRDKKGVRLCHVTLDKPIDMFLVKEQHTCLIAQIFPYFGKVSLRNKCVLTCKGQKDGLGGILAFRARNLYIDQTSKVDMSGKGFRGGAGGDRRGGGGLGGETFFCPAKEPNMGKGGDISRASWAKTTNGIGGGGGGDGPAQRKGSKGGQGAYNAGGGGADSRANSDDGAAGGGGGGHFSGGGGGGSGCSRRDGEKGGKPGKVTLFTELQAMGAKFYMYLLLVILVTSPVYCTRRRRPQDAEKSPLFAYGGGLQDDVRLNKACCATCGQGSQLCTFCKRECPSPSFCSPPCGAGLTCCCSVV